MKRIVCQFSCGAASAVATKLSIAARAADEEIVIVNAFIKEEHEDNRRFLIDCERWFGLPITILTRDQYNSSAREVWRRKRFMKSPFGATCSTTLKREVLAAFRLPDDVDVMGFTAEEEERALSHIERGARCPLIDKNLTKADCLAMVERAGIELPMMYRLGYNNANCIGCCKGGKGYWNKIRRDFPEQFDECARIEAEIGPSAFIFYDRETGERYPLTQLDPNSGTHNEILPDCSFYCAMAEEDIGIFE